MQDRTIVSERHLDYLGLPVRGLRFVANTSATCAMTSRGNAHDLPFLVSDTDQDQPAVRDRRLLTRWFGLGRERDAVGGEAGQADHNF
jgi:hypothetical protein